MLRLLIVFIFSIFLISCSVKHDGYPDNWGKRVTVKDVLNCPDITGNYVPYTPVGDPVHSDLLGALLCGKKERIRTYSLRFTHLDINQISPDIIKLTLLDNGKPREIFLLDNEEFGCSDGKIIMKCVKREEMYFSGYSNREISFEKNVEEAIVMHMREFGIGALIGLPSVISKSRYYRFLPSRKAKPGVNESLMPVAIPFKKKQYNQLINTDH